MKVFSFRNIIGLAAIGGAYAYAKKHGGFKNAFDNLMQKKDELVKDLGAKTGATSGLSNSSGYGSTASDPLAGSTGYGSKPYDRH